jgi:hypothetical protein
LYGTFAGQIPVIQDLSKAIIDLGAQEPWQSCECFALIVVFLQFKPGVIPPKRSDCGCLERSENDELRILEQKLLVNTTPRLEPIRGNY